MTVRRHPPSPSLANAVPLVELLRHRALERPQQPAHIFLPDGELTEIGLSYEALDRKARALGAYLQQFAPQAQRVLLLYPPGLDFIVAFWACLYAGAVAVPAYPPRPNGSLKRLQSIAADADPSIALTTANVLGRLTAVLADAPELGALRWVDTDGIADGWADVWRAAPVSGNSLALLQYTSGSTGRPKGVMLGQQNLLHNAALVYRACEHTPAEKYVSWLPAFHDMGFMAGVLQPLYGGFPVILMPPAAFLQRPLRWLQAISRHRATVSGGPNFAYELCVSKINPAERAQLDLTNWRVAFNGAEPVRHETLERFADAFRSCGFRRAAFYPCYGLAEATLMVSGGRKDVAPVSKKVQARALEQGQVVAAADGASDARSLVGCGRSLSRQELLIVDPERLSVCPPERVGEIWVSGPSVAMGYWNRPAETEETFGARLAGSGRGPFLRTGDLGFVQDEELFVTGRRKDLIIIRGLNHYPQDIELTVARTHAALRLGAGAAFSVDVAGEERLVVVYEIERRARVEVDRLIEDVRKALVEEHEVQAHAVVLIKAGSMPKTSSGKVQRHACRAEYIAGSLQVVGSWAARPQQAGAPHARLPVPELDSAERVGAWLLAQVAAQLNVQAQELDVEQPLMRYGLDSLTAVALAHDVETGLGVSLPVAGLLDRMTTAQLQAEVLTRLAPPPAAAAAPVRPVQAEQTDYPPSHGQRSLWFLQQLAPHSDAYHIAQAARIRTTLDSKAMQRVWQTLIGRHEALRTTFHMVGGALVQRVHAASPLRLEVEDAAAWSEPQLRQRLSAEAGEPFDLSTGPLLRVRLFRRAPADNVLLLVFHHIIADLWSLAVLLQEMGALYEAETRGHALKLPAPKLRYVDYAHWQSELLASSEGARLSSFWRGELAGEVPALQWPTERPRPAAQAPRAEAATTFHLSSELTARLKAVGQRRGATLFMTLLAAFEMLLGRYTQQDSFAVGTATAGRKQADLAEVVGYFVNPVVMRADLAGDPSFEAVLERVRHRTLRALAHQDFPFPVLVEQLQPHRQTSRPPLFQVMFVWQQSPSAPVADVARFALNDAGAVVQAGGLTLAALPLAPRTAQFDLTLMMTEGAQGLVGAFEHDAALFAAATIERMAEHFQCLLAGVAAAPRQRLSELPLLSERERRQLLVEWNKEPPAPRPRCLHETFEAQVERTPEAVALRFGSAQVTYRQLNERANQLAHHLRRQGVGAEVVVGVLLNRSVEMVASLLGVLKAGGAYLPLDPAYPAERLAFMIADTQARVLLTKSRLAALLPEHKGQVIHLDDARARLPTLATDNPERRARPDNLAYIIYTSGSTGTPKGIAIEHHNAVAMLDWAVATFSAHDLAGVLAPTSICFDISIFEMFAPLSCGGKIILVENALHLSSLAAADEVTLINTVPSVMSELAQTGWLPAYAHTVNLAGEVLRNSLVQRVYEHKQVERVLNLYGPSEDTTYSTCAFVGRGATDQPTIGRPITGGQLYILDRHMQLVPAGVAGEIYLSGAGISRGYLGRPALTAERFIPHPFSRRPGQRLYRTGDIGRHLANGEVEFLGRADTQVKVRGFRIELGEVEAVLCQHPSVRQAAVVVAGGDDGADARRLVAYLLVESERSPVAGELRRYLRERLPAHMLPAAYVMLDELPLTPSGKVDRRALPAFAQSGQGPAATWVAPRTATENKIAAVWQSVLGLEQVDIHTNFFELGGHSLSMVEVYRRLMASSGSRLGLTDLFDHPTVSALAKFFDRQTAHDAAPPADGAAGRRRQALARQRELALQGRKKR